MKALLVGAGAVGQVYGRHLQDGGAEVSFFVREKYLATCREGFSLQRLGRLCGGTARFTAPAISTLEGVAGQVWDQVWLCISATALRGEWLAPFLERLGESTTIVLLTPGLADRTVVGEHIADERIVQGMISMVSYQAPLPGEDREPGVAYWLPPLSPSPFTGEDARASAVAMALRAGSCPAKVVPNAPVDAARGSAVLMPHLVALELAGWSLSGLRKGTHLRLAADGSREALSVVAAHTGTKPAPLRPLIRPGMTRLLLLAAPCAVPFPLETYLRYHFTKVGDQTSLMIGEYLRLGAEHGLPTQALSELSALLAEARKGSGAVHV